MWKKGKPNESGWYITRRNILGSYMYDIFWFATKADKWMYVEYSELYEDADDFHDAGKYVEEWTEIPE